MKKIIFRICITLLIVLIMSLLLVTSTETGLQWVVALTQKAIPGSLSFSSVKGRFIGPLKLNGLVYSTDDLTFALESASLDWKLSRLLFLQLHIVDLTASGIQIETGERLNVRTDWNIHSEGFSAIEGTGSLSGNMNQLEIEQSVSAPVHALLRATVGDLIKEPRWDMDLTLNSVSLNRINSTWPEVTANAKVSSTGTVSAFDLHGDMDLEEKQYGQIAVSFSAGKEHDTWLARNLKVSVPGTEAVAELSGRYIHDDNAASFASHLVWNALSWPLQGKDPVITSREGTFDIKGAPDKYEIALTTDVTGQQIPQSSVKLHGTGSMSSVHVQSLTAKLMDGVLNANGSVKWDPSISWNASLNMKSINPGTQWPDWKGDLDMDIRAEGDMHKSSPRLLIENASVKGDLRGYPFSADTIFSMNNGTYHLKMLDVVSGSALLHASGAYSDVWDAQWDIAVPDLGELIPEGKGQINGKGTIRGKAALPKVTAEVNGSRISYESYQAGSLAIEMHVDTTGEENSLIDANAANILIDTQEIKNINLTADGNPASHSVSLSVETQKESVNISADAGYDEATWKGGLVQANLDLADYGVWKLRQPGMFVLSPQSADVRDLCWVQDAASVCIQALWTETEGLTGKTGLSDIPLSLFKPVIPSNISSEGLLAGDIDISYGNNTLYGTASIVLPAGSVSYALDEKDSVILPLGLTRLDTILNQDGIDLDFEMSLAERGKVSSSIRLPGFSPFDMNIEKQEVSARVQADLSTLDLLPLFTSVVAKPAGVISTDLSITGVLAHPGITGYVKLDKGQAELPDLGLLIKDMDLNVTSDSSGIVDIDGKLSSGKGTASVRGKLEIQDPATIKADIRVKGENVEALKIPQVWVVVSPDISGCCP